MRFVVLGAGAVGGVVGGRLFEHGYDVQLIARGAHHNTIRDHGLEVDSADGSVVLKIPVVREPMDVEFGPDDVVLVAVKTQDTAAALDALAGAAPANVPVVCVQNAVENERIALRSFARVYGVCVMCPTTHLAPGVVQANSSPVTGVLDVGCYPSGTDALAESLVEAFGASTFSSEAKSDILRWKYTKLLSNLGNAVEAVCGSGAGSGPIAELARHEGVTSLQAAGIDFVEGGTSALRGDLLQMRPIGDQQRPGASSWQSLVRATGSIETDYLNGEIVLLGRMHGIPTPINAALQWHANRIARHRLPPGSLTEEEFLQSVGVVVG